MAENIEVILVDIGSSIIKSAEVISGESQNRKTWSNWSELNEAYQAHPMIISSVRKNLEELKSKLTKSSDHVLDHTSKLPITLDYDSPETLGPDRIAAAVGAYDIFPDQDSLVIDMGTCMTLDLIDKAGVFRGGIISPGLKMRMVSMANYTSSLPDISDDWESIPEAKLGKTTKQSLFNGSFRGILHEINGTIETLKDDFASINIILTGGDAKFFDSRLKAHIFAGSKIVEIGLYRIWKYQ